MFLILSVFVVFMIWQVVRVIRGAHHRALHRRKAAKDTTLRVVFLHPDLGIGGAERLIVDAAVGLLSRQPIQSCVQVTIVTNFHDPKRAFTETTDGTLNIIVRGDFIPRHIRNKGHVLFATLRMIYAGVLTCLVDPGVDVYVVDQVSAVVPFLKLLASPSRVLFYCHFPDQLCDPSRATGRRSLLKQLYRFVFDNIESWTMSSCDSIVCNSKFSRAVTVETFPALAKRIDVERDIWYPPIDVANVRTLPANRATASAPHKDLANPSEEELLQWLRHKRCVLSINRYERKKNIPLAVEAFALAFKQAPVHVAEHMALIVAGGYDPRLPENVEHYNELKTLADDLGIGGHTYFLRSFTDRQKFYLLSHCECVLYTPSGEHFGIVPIEAMAFERVVIAVSDAGPLESVTIGDRFGLLRAPQPAAFANALLFVLTNPEQKQEISQNAYLRCKDVFSLETFSCKMVTRLLDLRTEAQRSL